MIELKNVVKVYINYNRNNVTALKGINLKLAATGLVCVAGPSGGGKSTLLNILSGVDIPTSGEMLVNGVNTDKFGTRGFDGYRNNFVGVIHQDLHLLDHLTLGQNVALATELKGAKPDGAEISALFKRLGIEELENRYPNQCSVGQCQRAAIARTLVKKPKVLIADEPTSSIDPDTRMEIFALLKELSKDTLVIAATHTRDMIERFADRILMIEQGKIVGDIITGGNNCNIELFDQGRVVAIEAGAVLEAGDVDKVNAIIAKNNKKGVFLCLATDAAKLQQMNPNASKEVVEAVLKQKKLGKQQEKKEKQQKIDAEGSGVFQFEKTKLPLKSAWRLSIVNFSSNKLRSIFTVLLSFLAIMFFILTTNMARVNADKLIINAYMYSSEPYVTFTSNSELFNKQNRFGDDKSHWTQNGTLDKSGLVYDLGKSAVVPAPNYAGGSNSDIYGVRRIVTSDTLNNGNTNRLNIVLYRGDGWTSRWPAADSSADNKSIVISDFVATQIQTAAYLHAINTPGLHPSSYVPSFQDMVSSGSQGYNTIMINNEQFTIIGIYATDFRDFFVFDENAPSYFKPHPEDAKVFRHDMMRIKDDISKSQKMRAEYLLQNDYVTAYVSKMFVDRIVDDTHFALNSLVADGDYFITDHSAGAPSGNMHKSIYNDIIENGSRIMFLEDPNYNSTGLAPGVIKVSEAFYNDVLGKKNVWEFSVAKRVQSYTVTPDWWSGLDTEKNVLQQVSQSYHVLRTFKFEVATDEFINSPNHDVMMYDTNLQELIQALILPSTSFVVAGGYSANTLLGILKRMGGDTTPMYANSAEVIETVGGFTTLSTPMITAAIALGVFVAALMYNYIFQSIRSKRKSIAVIRSMGAKTMDVFKIYFLEALLIAAFICAGAFLFTGIAILIANLIISAGTTLNIAIFYFDTPFVMLILGIATLIILASYMLPVFAYARQTKSKGLVQRIKVKSDN